MSRVHGRECQHFVRNRLRQATRPYHDRLEAIIPILDPTLSMVQLHQILRAFYGYYVPLESAMEAAAVGWLRPEVRRRRKVQWLVQDLVTLGDTADTIARLPLCRHLPVLATDAQVLGALYVVEGATLGGQVAARALRQAMGRGIGRFFESYGTQVGVMWGGFLERLEEAAANPDEERAILETACTTFVCFEQWLERLVDRRAVTA